MAVERAATVSLRCLSIGIKDLNLIAALKADAAVPVTYRFAVRIYRRAKLRMEKAASELLFASDIAMVFGWALQNLQTIIRPGIFTNLLYEKRSICSPLSPLLHRSLSYDRRKQ